jgi:hypothetical protein
VTAFEPPMANQRDSGDPDRFRARGPTTAGTAAARSKTVCRGRLALTLYKVTTEVAPTANQQFSLLFADDGSALPVAKARGLVVGTLA